MQFTNWSHQLNPDCLWPRQQTFNPCWRHDKYVLYIVFLVDYSPTTSAQLLSIVIYLWLINVLYTKHLYFLLLFSAPSFPNQHLHCRPENIITFPSFYFITLCASEAAAQCIVIAPVCLWVCLWVCYHDNSKLRPSILTKLGLHFAGKDSDHLQLIKFWPSCAPPGRRSAARRNFWLRLTTTSAQCLRLLRALFFIFLAAPFSWFGWVTGWHFGR